MGLFVNYFLVKNAFFTILGVNFRPEYGRTSGNEDGQHKR